LNINVDGMNGAAELSQEDAEARYAVYKEPEVAQFLAASLQRGGEIKPEYDPAYGYRYPEVEESIGRSPSETMEFLGRLAGLGVLERKVVGMVLRCPSCDSANVSTNYVCSFCGSPRIIRNALIEHITCGHTDNITSFRVDGDLICPKCKAHLRKGDYRNAGSWYECSQCGKPVETPRTIHICRQCNETFVFDDAKYVEVYAYSLGPEVVTDIKEGALFSSLLKPFLAGLKGNLRVPGRVAGKSGVIHEFDALLEMGGGKIIAIDALISKQPVSPTAIIGEYGKILDAKVEAYIVASPSLSEDAKKLAVTYGLKMIVGDPLGVLGKLKEAFPLKLAVEKKEAIRERVTPGREGVKLGKEGVGPGREEKVEGSKLTSVRKDLVNELLDVAKMENKTLYAVTNEMIESTIDRYRLGKEAVREGAAAGREEKVEGSKLTSVRKDLVNELLDVAKMENKTLYAVTNGTIELAISRYKRSKRVTKPLSSKDKSEDERHHQ
jgi:hypothetical protein